MTNKPRPTPGYHQESPVFIFLSNPQTVDLGVPCPDLWPWPLAPRAGVPGAPVPARVVSPVTQHTIGSQYTFGGWGLPLLFAPQGDVAPPGSVVRAWQVLRVGILCPVNVFGTNPKAAYRTDTKGGT